MIKLETDLSSVTFPLNALTAVTRRETTVFLHLSTGNTLRILCDKHETLLAEAIEHELIKLMPAPVRVKMTPFCPAAGIDDRLLNDHAFTSVSFQDFLSIENHIEGFICSHKNGVTYYVVPENSQPFMDGAQEPPDAIDAVSPGGKIYLIAKMTALPDLYTLTGHDHRYVYVTESPTGEERRFKADKVDDPMLVRNLQNPYMWK